MGILPVTLVGAGIACGRYIESVGECSCCGEINSVVCSSCELCLDCCECRQDEEEGEEFTAKDLFEMTIEMNRIELEEEKQRKYGSD